MYQIYLSKAVPAATPVSTGHIFFFIQRTVSRQIAKRGVRPFAPLRVLTGHSRPSPPSGQGPALSPMILNALRAAHFRFSFYLFLLPDRMEPSIQTGVCPILSRWFCSRWVSVSTVWDSLHQKYLTPAPYPSPLYLDTPGLEQSFRQAVPFQTVPCCVYVPSPSLRVLTLRV